MALYQPSSLSYSLYYDTELLQTAKDFIPQPPLAEDASLCDIFLHWIDDLVLRIRQIWNYYFGDGKWYDENYAENLMMPENFQRGIYEDPMVAKVICEKLNSLKKSEELAAKAESFSIDIKLNELKRLRVGFEKSFYAYNKDEDIASNYAATLHCAQAVIVFINTNFWEKVDSIMLLEAPSAYSSQMQKRRLLEELGRWASCLFDVKASFESDLRQEKFVVVFPNEVKEFPLKENLKSVTGQVVNDFKEVIADFKHVRLKILDDCCLNEEFLLEIENNQDVQKYIVNKFIHKFAIIPIIQKRKVARASYIPSPKLKINFFKYLEELGFSSKIVWESWSDALIQLGDCFLSNQAFISNRFGPYLSRFHVKEKQSPLYLDACIKDLPHLTTFSYQPIERYMWESGIRLRASTMECIGGLKHLTHLSLSHINAFNDHYIHLYKLGAAGLQGKEWNPLGNLLTLKSLSLGTQVKGKLTLILCQSLFENIAKLTRLEQLSLTADMPIFNRNKEAKKEGLIEKTSSLDWNLTPLTQLKVLTIIVPPMTKSKEVVLMRNMIEPLTSLRELSLVNVPVDIGQLTQLTSFSMAWYTKESLPPLSNKDLPLESVSFNVDLPEGYLEPYCALPNIKKIHFKNEAKVTDENRAILAKYHKKGIEVTYGKTQEKGQ